MTEEKPWWRPIADAVAKKIADAILDPAMTTPVKLIVDAAFDDVPAKAPRTRRKALPARLDTPRVEPPSDTEK